MPASTIGHHETTRGGPNRDSAIGRFACAAITALLLSLTSCQNDPQTAAIERVRSFIFDLASARYESAADAIRSEDGSALTATMRAQRIAEWRRAYGDGTQIALKTFTVTGVRASTRDELPASIATGYQVVFALEGTSQTPCFLLPNTQATDRVVLIERQWYVLPDSLNTLRPRADCTSP